MPCPVKVTVGQIQTVSVGVGGNSAQVSVSAPVIGGGTTPAYMGPYEYTPTQETQTVAIAGKAATQNITINPIPSNYGLITWNGSVLTVS